MTNNAVGAALLLAATLLSSGAALSAPPGVALSQAAAETFNVYFEPDSAKLTPEGDKLVQGLARLIAIRPYRAVLVTGHTDTRRGRRRSLALSQAMAEAVRSRLVSFGIDQARIVARARGSSSPAVPTRKGVSEPNNRRVEVQILR